jgi:hypothetical protein
MPAIKRASVNALLIPAATPIVAIHADSPRTMRSTCSRSAPRAMRIPIPLVRRHRLRHDSIDPDAGENESEQAKPAGERCEDALLSGSVADPCILVCFTLRDIPVEAKILAARERMGALNTYAVSRVYKIRHRKYIDINLPNFGRLDSVLTAK